ncbi:tetratricopeptide repeat protein [candidate division KSB1 bacterium]|nr:tetratricopeptide repeat protein [candidate division KSB1 bacterium]
MRGNKLTTWSVTFLLLIVAIGFFLVCAQQRATVSGGDEVASDDDEFRQQLLQLMELTEDSDQQPPPLEEQDTSVTPPAGDESDVAVGEDDVMSFLLAENEQPSIPPEGSQTMQTDDLALSPEMFETVNQDIKRLEKRLERKTMTIDSIKRVIENRDRRLKELESQPRAQASTTGGAGRIGSRSSRNPVDPAFASTYQSGRSHFEQFRYPAAIEAFQKLLKEYPNHTMADNCQYWIGECYYGLKQYQQAIVEFQKVFAYSETDKHDDAQLMIGLCYMRSGQKDKAQKEFETFLNNYSTSEYASIAKRYYRNI